MVDKIKALNSEPVKREQNINNAANSPSALKENFKSISSNLSVAQVSKQTNLGAKKSDEQAFKLSSSLKDAVKYSKQALKVLEDVTASELSPNGVEKLLSEENVSEIRVPPRKRDSVSVAELAGDLEALKDNLSSLFEALKLKSDQTEVYSENKKASQVDIGELEEAQAKADSTSMKIQFNGKQALYAHNGITIDSVASLLSSADPAKL